MAIGSVTLSILTFGGYYLSDSRAAVYRYVAMPAIRAFLPDPEDGHALALSVMERGLVPKDRTEISSSKLHVSLCGRPLDSPVGVAAGLDKDGKAIDALFNLGFSYVEIGTITPEFQSGNPKPRYFRIPALKAVINRLGFPSDGIEPVERRLRTRIRQHFYKTKEGRDVLAHANGDISTLLDEQNIPRSLHSGKLLGINLGKMKSSAPDSIEDYITGIRKLGPYADVLVINISSPNTPGLRDLQSSEHLPNLLSKAKEQRDELPHKPVLCVKIAPDLDTHAINIIADAVTQSGSDAVMVTNTTIQRPQEALAFPEHSQMGGLSGTPLKQLSLNTLEELRKALFLRGSEAEIIGCGGISSGLDALEFRKHGAQIIQSYTGFGYDGVGYAARLKEELIEILGDRSWESYK